MKFPDARDYQILFLALFLLLGISTRDWTLQWDLMLVAIASCCTTQLFLSLLVSCNTGGSFRCRGSAPVPTPCAVPTPCGRDNHGGIAPTHQNLCGRPLVSRHRENTSDSSPPPPSSPKLGKFSHSLASLRSALITALGLCLLLRANEPTTMAIAGCLAISSKFLFRVRGKHFFNPANFGIIAALLFTSDAWVSPGQWGTDWWYLLLFAGTGGMVLQKVGRWDTSAAFFAAYAGLEAIRNLWLGQGWDIWAHQLTSGSLLLFALFMLTDPRSIPNARIARLLWAIAIAGLAFILHHQLYLSTAIFWALFLLSPLTIVLDSVWEAPRFSWQGIRRQFAGFANG